MKKIALFLLLILAALTVVSCKTETTGVGSSDNDDTSTVPTNVGGTITLQENAVDVSDTGAVYENGVLKITAAGIYTLTGKNENLAVFVEVPKTEQIELILDGATITNPKGPAIYCDSADRLFLTVKEGTVNTLSDGKDYPSTAAVDGPNATVYSDDDLTIRGTGMLIVKGIYKNAISSKNDIKIKEVQLTVDAFNTGIRGKESIVVESGKIKVTAGNDGLKVSEEMNAEKGFLTIEDGDLIINAGDDCLQAGIVLNVNGGKIDATAGGKVTNAPTENIKAGVIASNTPDNSK